MGDMRVASNGLAWFAEAAQGRRTAAAVSHWRNMRVAANDLGLAEAAQGRRTAAAVSHWRNMRVASNDLGLAETAQGRETAAAVSHWRQHARCGE
jgi:hypothetical protein